ncbi:uncharacterized protein ACHE_70044S [Aspergillus chevalieri]|uniref:Mitochondrial thiamine pyrophosphate carrier 1 n=1 Tax=Aspergillus chevalieri TaxID=182096 RepID=A0A7R7VUW8_ASPCH|nr:uncharacterized protein ACHE_70044S [Aspergillus chevalieri]BCR91201.1 hypothetical protein ACHE_70044S [Aspergillus chevalieri]
MMEYLEEIIRGITGKSKEDKLRFGERILASTIGGALSCWNQPFEVLRVEMQSIKNDPTRPAHPTMVSSFTHIIKTSGIKGIFQGIVPRIGVAAWATICMVGFGDTVRSYCYDPHRSRKSNNFLFRWDCVEIYYVYNAIRDCSTFN